MEQLLEDYKRKLENINRMIDNTSLILNNDALARLQTKRGCYRTFIVELEREL